MNSTSAKTGKKTAVSFFCRSFDFNFKRSEKINIPDLDSFNFRYLQEILFINKKKNYKEK